MTTLKFRQLTLLFCVFIMILKVRITEPCLFPVMIILEGSIFKDLETICIKLEFPPSLSNCFRVTSKWTVVSKKSLNDEVDCLKSKNAS